MTAYSEDSLVEQPAIELFKELGWEVANCYKESFNSTLIQALARRPFPTGRGGIGQINLGRETAAEVVLISRLRSALEKLNPDLPPEAIDAAIEALRLDRSAMSLVEANRQIYKLLKNGVKVQSTTLSPNPSPRGRGEDEKVVRVKVIDWEHSENNDFFLASQFWITGDVYRRRADLVGFVNGLRWSSSN